MTVSRSEQIGFGQFANVYVPFALLVALALLAPEQTQNPDLYRTKLTVWATTILLIPSMCLFFFWGISRSANNYWLLLWTFSFLSYLVHFYYGTFVTFDGIGDTFVKQGTLIAGSNFLLTFWWGIDVFLAWASRSPPRWMWIQRVALHAFVFVVFVIANVFLRGGSIRSLGIAFAVVVALCFLIRLYIAPGQKVEAQEA